MSMKKFTDDTYDLLRKVNAFDDWEKAILGRETARADSMMDYALKSCGLSKSEVEPVELSDESPEDLSEDKNRSDSETAFFFDDREQAMEVYEAAIRFGLEPGEVTFDDTVDPKYGMGEFALRFAPHVRETKAAIFLGLLEVLADVIDEDFLEDYVNALEEGNTALSEGGVPWHDASDGEFTSKKKLAQAGRGSWSISGKKKQKVAGKAKNQGVKLKFAKNPCGRAARAIGKTTRCWDGKEGADFWKSAK